MNLPEEAVKAFPEASVMIVLAGAPSKLIATESFSKLSVKAGSPESAFADEFHFREKRLSVRWQKSI